MKKQDLIRRLAKASGVTQAKAADRLDRAIHRILVSARRGGRRHAGKASRD